TRQKATVPDSRVWRWAGYSRPNATLLAPGSAVQVPADDAEPVPDGGGERPRLEAAVRLARQRDEARRARVADGDDAEQALDFGWVADQVGVRGHAAAAQPQGHGPAALEVERPPPAAGGQ